MGIPVELPQLGLRHTTPLAPADARRKGLGADAKLESVTNRALPTYGNHYERRSSATATSESRSPSPSVSADAASAVLARAGQRLLDALPRLESTLERPVDPAEHLDFRNDFLQVAVAVEDFMDLATEGARNGTLPEQLAENFRTLASNRRVVADGETMSQLWDRMGFGIGGDYAFLERDTMRTGLLEYCSRVRQAINDYGYATDNDQLAWAFEVPLAVPGDPTPPGTPGWMRSPSYRIAVSRGVVDPPGAEPAQDRQQVAKTGKGALERLQAVGHSIVARLRSMFAGIGNVKDRLVHRKTDAGMSAFEALSFHCLQDQAQANLLTGLPRLASRLQAPVAKMDDAGFERDFNRVQAGMEGLAMLSSRNALEGVVPKRLAREIGVLANTGTVANGETGWQLADRMLHNDFSFLRTADGHRELSAHVGKAHDAFLKYARATGDHRLVSRLEADGVDHVDGSALDARPPASR